MPSKFRTLASTIVYPIIVNDPNFEGKHARLKNSPSPPRGSRAVTTRPRCTRSQPPKATHNSPKKKKEIPPESNVTHPGHLIMHRTVKTTPDTLNCRPFAPFYLFFFFFFFSQIDKHADDDVWSHWFVAPLVIGTWSPIALDKSILFHLDGSVRQWLAHCCPSTPRKFHVDRIVDEIKTRACSNENKSFEKAEKKKNLFLFSWSETFTFF